MATFTPSSIPSTDTDAHFRAWGKSISDTIKACGWTQTSDTGQIDWITVLRPTANYQLMGYEIFAMADALQATAPIFIKVSYGSSGGTNFPGVYFVASTGTNGAGAQTGQVSAQFQLITTFFDSATSYQSRVSGANNRLAYYLWYGWSGYGSMFSIERTHDQYGADTNEGFLIMCGQEGTSYFFTQVVPMTGTIPAQQQHGNATLPPTGSGAYGTDIYLYPLRAWGRGESGPSLNIALFFAANLTADVVVSATMWDGSAHTILPTTKSFSNSYYGGQGYVAMRWE